MTSGLGLSSCEEPAATLAATGTSNTASGTTPSSSTTKSIATAALTSSKKTNVGAIAGGVVGGVAVLASLVIGALWWRKRRSYTAIDSHPMKVVAVSDISLKEEPHAFADAGAGVARSSPYEQVPLNSHVDLAGMPYSNTRTVQSIDPTVLAGKFTPLPQYQPPPERYISSPSFSPAPPSFTTQNRYGCPENTTMDQWDHAQGLAPPVTTDPFARLPTPGGPAPPTPAPSWQPSGYAAYLRD